MSAFIEKVPNDSFKIEEQKNGNELYFSVPESEINWYELRLLGKYPERRGYQSSFVHNKKYYQWL